MTKYFYISVLAIFFFIISPHFLAEGMFLDGITYAAVAKNYAQGLGNFWNLHYCLTLYPEFHEHPPLAIVIQSWFFTLFGSSFYVEKIYSVLCILGSGGLMVGIWNSLKLSKSLSFLPLLLFFTIQVVSWSAVNNLLENTMLIFILLSTWLLIKADTKPKILLILLAGVFLSLAVLCKGLTALFLWTFPFLYALLWKKQSVFSALVASFWLIVFTVLPLIILFYMSDEAAQSILKYYNRQIVGSFENPSATKHRLYILTSLFTELLVPLILFVLTWALAKKANIQPFNQQVLPLAMAFIGCGLSGVLPIMISQKQSAFYILCTYPFFSIGLGILMRKPFEYALTKWNDNEKGKKIFKVVAVALFGVALVINVLQVGRIGRNKDKLKLLHTVIAKVPKGAVIGVSPELNEDWSLRAYFIRYANISLDPDQKYPSKYFISKQKSIDKNFKELYQADSFYFYQKE